MSKIFTTKKGTAIPLMNLKGKDYMMVAYRIQWFTEEVPKFNIETEFLLLTSEETVVKARVTVLDEAGNKVRHAEGTKRETKKDFADHTEKAETAAIGRALIQLGFGTQFALSDMEEGLRLADSPLAAVEKEPAKDKPKSNKAEATGKTESQALVQEKVETTVTKEPAKKVSKFAPKAKLETVPSEAAAGTDDGWG